jgi:hypothetical protein
MGFELANGTVSFVGVYDEGSNLTIFIVSLCVLIKLLCVGCVGSGVAL